MVQPLVAGSHRFPEKIPPRRDRAGRARIGPRGEGAGNHREERRALPTQAEKNRLMEEFDQALQGLQNGAMKPNPALLEQMKQLDLKDLAKLTPEQLRATSREFKKERRGHEERQRPRRRRGLVG